MKKILLIILLTTVSSIEYIAKAQGFKAEERQKIVNYVNCYYTARYILNNPDYKQENKAPLPVVSYTILLSLVTFYS